VPTPEELARQNIDALLKQCGWIIQKRSGINLSAGRGIAITEGLMKGGDEVDYLLFVDGKAIGTVEAKPEGHTLTGVEEQSGNYGKGLLDIYPKWRDPLPFAYESTGVETQFTNQLDPSPKSRNVFAFHRPETLVEYLGSAGASPAESGASPDSSSNLNARLCDLLTTDQMPKNNLWSAQIEAIRNLGNSLAANKRRALIQMATGSGKTYTAVNFVYRLIKLAGARRVLFPRRPRQPRRPDPERLEQCFYPKEQTSAAWSKGRWMVEMQTRLTRSSCAGLQVLDVVKLGELAAGRRA
jgi:type I restriction enzyme R subunit